MFNLEFFWFFVEFVCIILCGLVSGGFFTLLERKVMALMQFRLGPSKVLIAGFFQPLSDALKLISKTNVSSELSVDLIYYFSPLMSLFISILTWITFPVFWEVFSWYSSILFIVFCFSISVYGVMFSGWFSRSKYALLGCVRALSQSVSYEIPLSTSVFCMVLIFSSFSLKDINGYQEIVLFLFPLHFMFICLLIIFIAEINRAPFDLAEGESELVSGFSVELGSSSFVLVFLSEYVALSWSCVLMSLLFLGCLNEMFGLKVLLIMFLLVWIRCSFPRVRFDDVMLFCWTCVLPLSICFLVFSLMFL